MIVYLYVAIAFVVGYLFGNINFARVFSARLEKKDITTIGSKNPGTMNMLRTQGFGRAMLTLICEALKVGLPALACYFIFQNFYLGFENLAYFLSAFGGVLGHCFPALYKFKGGKGVACTFGMFVFHPNFWWLALVIFVICFCLFFFISYPFIISHIFILVMSVYATFFFVVNSVMWWIPLIVIVWLNFALIVVLHRANIKRLINGTENKVNFKEKVMGAFKKKDKEVQVDDSKDDEVKETDNLQTEDKSEKESTGKDDEQTTTD